YTGGAPYTTPSVTQQYGEKVKLPVEARALARSFIRDGVLRHDPWAARSMVSAKLQSVATTQQWKAGTIPVPQFPDSVFAGAAYKVLRSRSHDVLLDVQMASTNPSVTKSLDLLIEMKPVGGHWIVVSAAPRNSTPGPLLGLADSSAQSTPPAKPPFSPGTTAGAADLAAVGGRAPGTD